MIIIRSDLLESLASEAAKENLALTVRTLDVTKKVTSIIDVIIVIVIVMLSRSKK